MLPCKEQSVHVGNKVWGRMPTGEIMEFESPYEYQQAYQKEYDLYIDDMYQLENEHVIEFPEDYPVYA